MSNYDSYLVLLLIDRRREMGSLSIMYKRVSIYILLD